MKRTIFIVTAFLTAFILVGLGSQSAMAYDGILFPYFTSGGGDMTFVQVLNSARVGTPITGTSQGGLHYTYVYNKAPEVCQHYDDNGRTTRNDIFLYEVTGQIAGQLLPGDTTSTSPKLTVAPAYGYLTIQQNSANFALGLEGTLRGQAIIVNVNSGTVFTYNAINDPDEVDGTMEFYSNADDHHFWSFLPETFASTTWYVFPIDGSDLETDLVLDSTIEIGHHPYHDDADGVYDNNESLKSGLKYLMAGCWDTTMDVFGSPVAPGSGPMTANFFYTLPQIMSAAQYNAVKGTGGWTGQYNWDYGYSYKIQSSTVLGKPMSTLIYEPSADTGYSSYIR